MKSATRHVIRPLRTMRRCLPLLALLAGIVCSLEAQAAYTFKIIQYPGAALTQLWGVDNLGHALGEAWHDADQTMPIGNFLYDLTTGSFTLLTPLPSGVGLLGINDLGETVGSKSAEFDDMGNLTSPEAGEIRNANGTFRSPVLHPAPLENTEFRAVNNSGLVSGFAYDDVGDTFNGFIYNPAHGTFTDLPFVDSPQVIAQGINAPGQLVGSVILPDGGLYAGVPFGVYGFLRSTNGAITLFQVNGVCTRARGINDSGLVAGWTRACAPGNHASGFVGPPTGPFQQLNVPGATDTTPQAINDSGVVVGSTESEGFIASPNKDDCKGSGWQSLVSVDGTSFKNQGACIQYVNTGK